MPVVVEELMKDPERAALALQAAMTQSRPDIAATLRAVDAGTSLPV